MGRAEQVRFVTQRMQGTQMTSVGIVGPRRIGKSSLLYHIYQTYPQRLAEPQRFLVGYASLQDPRVRTQVRFVQTVAGELAQARGRHPNVATLPAWPVPCHDLITLDQGLRAIHDAGLRCVLCLDEFEALLEAPQQFGNGFYDALRAWMDDQLLMLIMASARPLTYYGGRHRFVSRFFNLGNTAYLDEFGEAEARTLVKTPAIAAAGPALGVRDQELALELGGRHPYFLQMAAHYIYEAQVNGQDEAWVREQFSRQADPHRRPTQRAAQRLAGYLWQAPDWVGQAAGWVGATWDNTINRIVGILIIVLVLLALLGALPVREALQWATAVFGALFVGFGLMQSVAPRWIEGVAQVTSQELVLRIAGYEFGPDRWLLTLFGISVGLVGGAAFSVEFVAAFGTAVGVGVGVVVGLMPNLGFAKTGAIVGGILGGTAYVVTEVMRLGSRSGIVSTLTTCLFVSLAGLMAFGPTFAISFVVAWMIGMFRLCFWPLEMLWMTMLSILRKGQSAGETLRRLPIYYDEFIILSLPQLVPFLAEAYRANQASARQAIDYLTTHSLQQPAARRAQVLIALDRLARCQHTPDIAAASDELRWIAQPPPELGATLPALLDVSQGVRAASQATSRYRQQQALERQIEQLRSLRESLVAGSTAHASQFGAIIDRWHGILAGAIQVLKQARGEEDEIPIVYIAGPHLRPSEAQRLFKGRDDVFREIETALLAPRPPVLVLEGQRRTGKTSLIAYLPQRLPAEVVPVRVNVQRAASAASNAGLAYSMAQEIVDSARQTRNLFLPTPALADFQLDPFVALGDWLGLVERTAAKRDFLLCLDEFQRLDEVITATGSRAALNFLRDLLEHRRRWRLLLAGSTAAEEMAAYWSDALINTRRVRISYLLPAEARELIEHPVPGFEAQMRYEPTAVETILRLTHGQPYLVQLLCAELVDRLNLDQRRTANADDVDAVVEGALEHGSSYFQEIWDSAAPAEQSILLRVAGGAALDGDPQALARLVRRELLEPDDGAFRFQVPLVQCWFQRQAQSTPRR